MAEQSLKDKTVKGTFWSAADAFLGQGVTFVVGIVLARLLTPEEFGLVGIVLVFVVVLSGIVDAGFSQALIRKKNTTEDDYNTLFIVNFAASIILFVLLYIVSPFIADFFSRTELTALTRVTGLVLLFQALSIAQTTILAIKIDFKTKTKASVISSVLSGIIGVAMAFWGYGVWALVGQRLSATLIYTLCMWILVSWCPRPKFNLESFHYMWGFGWKLLLSGILNNVWNQLYQVVVGKFYCPSSLGQYTRSEQFANVFSGNLTNIVLRVSYPALSQLQDDKKRMTEAYRRIIKITMFVTVNLMFCLGAISDPLIYCFIGPQWYEAASFLPLICVSLSFYPLQAINLNMIQIQGRTDIFLIIEFIKKIVAIGPLLLGVFLNIYWMLIGSIFSSFICFFINSNYSGRSLGYTSLMQLRDVAPAFIEATAIAFTIFFLNYLPYSNWFILFLQVFVALTLFLAINELIKLPEYIEVKAMIKNFVRRKTI